MGYLIDPHSERRYQPVTWPKPFLIHGREGGGASFATVVLAAELVRAGEPVVWLCHRPTAIRALQTELGMTGQASVTSKEVSASVARPLAESQLVTMHGAGDFLLTSLRALPDWDQRWVMVKNVETTLSPALWHVLERHPRLVLSGDCTHVTQSFQPAAWPTKILYSDPPRSWSMPWTELAPYVGRLYQAETSSAIMAIDRPTKNPAI